MLSRKKAYTQAVAFSPAELTSLWRSSRAAPTTPRKPNPSQLDAMLLGRSEIGAALELPVGDIQRLLQGSSERGLQLRFDAFLEALTQEFETKRLAFLANWRPENGRPESPPPSKEAPKPKTSKPKTSKALAIQEERPNDLVDPRPATKELKHKLGYNIFENLAALHRASEVSRSSLARMRDGLLVRRHTLGKVVILGRLAPRTVARRLAS